MSDRRLNEVVVPARVRLSNLEPIGVGTADCESLPGYVSRLADVHQVSEIELIDYVCKHPPFPSEYYGLSVGPRLYAGQTPGLFAMRLAGLTGVASVETLGMPWADQTISFASAVRGESAWCAACWREDLGAGRPAYERLLWKFHLYDRCHRHGLKLDTACAICGLSQRRGSTDVARAALCAGCGTHPVDLLVQEGAARATTPMPPMSDVRCVQLLAAIVSKMRAYGRNAHWPNFERAQRLYKAAVLLEDCSGKLQVVRRYATQVYKMSRGERHRAPIQFEAVVKLAVALEVPVSKLFKAGWRRADFT